MLDTQPTLQNQPAPETASYLVDNPRFPFCKGCGHNNVIRRLNEALVALQIPPHRVALVTDIGCIGLADGLFKEIHTVHTTHGRSTAFATGIVLADSVLADGQLKTIVLIGDGGSMIGLQHLVHAAMLNVDLTVLICNNFVYGMTGGQGSGLTPECFVTATTPRGNIVPPVDICEILKSSNAPFVARTTATDTSLPQLLRDALSFDGFAAIEILELCTEFAVPSNELTGKKLLEIAGQNNWQLGVVQNVTNRATFDQRYSKNLKGAELKQQRLDNKKKTTTKIPLLRRPVSILIAGSAGERVQSSASLLCQAAVHAGLVITQKNDNPVTQGSGFSLSEVWLSPAEIHYTGIEKPDHLILTSIDGYREIKSQRWFERLGSNSHVYVDDTIEMDGEVARVDRIPLRKVFGPKRAAIGALMYVAKTRRLVDAESLYSVISQRYPDETNELFQKVDELIKGT